ncbi:MAG: sensor domain-containing diguanylate cyclase [Hyphomicrobiales bacterium]|nr:sensor domain-containing diguanylate cyclase [Hyphomicrobiales bacterium]
MAKRSTKTLASAQQAETGHNETSFAPVAPASAEAAARAQPQPPKGARGAAESSRLAALRRYQILDTPPEGAFDDITTLASKYFGVPISIVSLVDEDRVWFKSIQGIPGVRQIDRGPGLCASAVLSDQVYVAEDLRKDPNSMANPLVASESGFRFYAAAPLMTSEGYGLGTMCVIDTKPRTFGADDAAMLSLMGRIVMNQMDARINSRKIAGLAEKISQENSLLSHVATHDALTGVLNRHAMQMQFDEYRQKRKSFDAAVLLIDIDYLKTVNDTYGHNAGDSVIREVASRIVACVRPTDAVARYGGEEFVVLLKNCDRMQAIEAAERIRRAIAATPVVADDISIPITASCGLVVPEAIADLKTAISGADVALYKAKHAGRNRVIAG